MRTCPKCKAAIESDAAKFCRHCGSPLSGASVPTGGGGVPSAPDKASDDSSRTGQRPYVRTTEIFIPADDTPRKPRPKPRPTPDRHPTQPKPPTPQPPVPQPEEEAPTFSVPAPKPVTSSAPVGGVRVSDTKASYGLFSAVGHVIRNYARFSGRAPRSEYWYLWIFNLLAFVVWVIVGASLAGNVPDAITNVWISLYGLYSLFMIVPGMAVTCRRLHDTNRSGWMMLLALVPFVGAVILLIMLAQPGTPYTNTYGPPPRS